MKSYIIRLDDASEYRNKEKWDRMEQLLEQYDVHPLVGVIPNTQDERFIKEGNHHDLWESVDRWQGKRWTVAMHGYTHEYQNSARTIAEFNGLSLEEARYRIRKAMEIFQSHGVHPEVFFAPSHQFNDAVLEALKKETDIRIVSDGYASRPYCRNGITFIPAQTGRIKKMPYQMTTSVYHPNAMGDTEFVELERFIQSNQSLFVDFPLVQTTKRKHLSDYTIEFALKASRLLRRWLLNASK